ncbi:GGDEF domain-containing protein [Paenibacillus sp. N3.4]|uniref:GGDEF domain-containing protein n=1 Tax=Paenibacillus sp. N3.4 TaxID=2603222 RepID=UPI001C9C5495|nr:GGDEF domain-containing protein [Paenibacillus sp. N3.4]
MFQSGAWIFKYAMDGLPVDLFVILLLGVSCLLGYELGKQFDKAKFLAERDELTGMYNRRHVHQVFPRLKSEMDRKHKKLAVLIIDMNDFKLINDTQGHDAGDKVLKAFARLLLTCKREEDIAARWGGDEFLLLCPDVGENEVHHTLSRIKTKLNELVISQGNIEISVGSAIYPDDAQQMKELVQRADWRMYQYKNKENRGERGVKRGR